MEVDGISDVLVRGGVVVELEEVGGIIVEDAELED
jgi:hypothetical protein